MCVCAYRITMTIIAPTPLVAANFVILGRIIGILGTQYSRLGPKLCMSPNSRFISSTLISPFHHPPPYSIYHCPLPSTVNTFRSQNASQCYPFHSLFSYSYSCSLINTNTHTFYLTPRNRYHRFLCLCMFLFPDVVPCPLVSHTRHEIHLDPSCGT